MKPWKETSRSSKTTTSFRRGLAATPSRLPVKAAFIYVSFSHFDYCKDYVDVSDIWCNRLLFSFLILFEHCVMMSMLCNCCVRELLILARTWFAFGLTSKTGCDKNLQWMVRDDELTRRIYVELPFESVNQEPNPNQQCWGTHVRLPPPWENKDRRTLVGKGKKEERKQRVKEGEKESKLAEGP
jgi:hypothetical protein